MNKRLISGLLIASLISTQLPVMTLATNVLPENEVTEETSIVQPENEMTEETNIVSEKTTTVEPIGGGDIVENTESLENNLENDSSETMTPEQIEDYSEEGIEAQEARISLNGIPVVAYAVEGGNIYFFPEGGEILDADITVTNVVIPESINSIPVTTIGDRAFSGCDLESIVIPNSVTTIENNAFNQCKNLKSVDIPNSVTTIEYFAFENCENLKEIIIPNSITTIEYFAFEGCKSLESIVIPNSVTTIGNTAFGGCENLKEIIIPNSVTTIGDRAFSYCKSLESIDIPNSVTIIGESAFNWCSNLKEVIISNGVTTIGDSAFKDCKNLESVVIPDSVTTIGNSAFENCENLCKNLKEFIIPNSVMTIGDRAFEGCKSLESVVIPDSVTTIGDWAFAMCYLKEIIMPNSVTTIGQNAFTFNNLLKNIYYAGSKEEWEQIDIHEYNDTLESTNVTIHYNSTGPDDIGQKPVDPDQDQIYASIDYLSNWSNDNEIYLNYNNEFGNVELYRYFITEQTDLSGLNREQLLNHYVLIETKLRPDSVVEYDVVSIKPVESKIGTLNGAKDETFTIDGVTYPYKNDSGIIWVDSLYDAYIGQPILYHLYNGSIIDYEILEKKTGILEHCNNDKGILTIDGKQYPMNTLTDKSFMANILYLMGKNIVFYTGDTSQNPSVPIFKIENYITGTGLLNRISENEVFINGVNFEIDNPHEIEDLVNKRVFYLLHNDKIVHIDALEKLSNKLSIQLKMPELLIMRSNGKFEYSIGQIDVTNMITYELPTGYDFSIIYKDPYFEGKNGAITLNNLQWNSGQGLRIGSLQNEVENVTLAVGETWSKRIGISPVAGYIPSERRELVKNSVVLTSNQGDTITKQFEITVSYNEVKSLREKIAENQQKRDNRLNAADDIISQSVNQLDASFQTAIVLPPNLQNYIITDKGTQEQLKYALTMWVTSLLTQEQAESVEDKIKHTAEKALTKQWEQVFGSNSVVTSIDWNVFDGLDAKADSIKANTTIQVKDKNNKYIDIVFYYNGLSTGVSKETSAGWGPITYQVKGLNSQYNRWSQGDMGQVVMTNIDQFANDLYDVAENAINNFYEESVGEAINEVSGYVFKDIVTKLINKKCGSYSQGLFKVVTGIVKKTKISCPVDVYVYDVEGTLCGSIVDNQVIEGNSAVNLYVEDDDKYVWCGGDDFKIQCVGTDEGTMDYVVSEYDESDELLREVTFNDIALTKGKTYNGMIPFEGYVNKEAYNLTADDGAVLIADTDTYVPPTPEDTSNTTNAPTIESLVCDMNQNKATFNAHIVENGATVTNVLLGYTTGEFVKYVEMTSNQGQWTVTIDVPDQSKGVSAFVMALDTDHNQVTTDAQLFEEKKEIEEPKPEPDPEPNPEPIPDPEDPILKTKKGSTSISNSYPRNDISIIASQGGTIKANTTHTTKGSPVTLTIKPNDGYTLDTITVTDKEGNTIEVTTKDTNQYQFTMPDSNVEVSATFKEVTKETPAQQQTPNVTTLPFTDVANNAWYRDAVAYVYQKGMMQGDGSETIFNPQGNTTGGMIVTILHRLEGTPKVSTAISTGEWFSDAVNWAIENQIVETTFMPKEVITREQLADVFYRYTQYKGGDTTQRTDLSHFVDSQVLSETTQEAMQWANATGLLNGMTDTTLDPKGSTTRAQLATILTRFTK